MVEFALVLPVLLIVLLAIMKFGLLFENYLTLTDAVRSGARTLAIGRGTANACTPANTSFRTRPAASGRVADDQSRGRRRTPGGSYCWKPGGGHWRLMHEHDLGRCRDHVSKLPVRSLVHGSQLRTGLQVEQLGD